MKIKDWHSMLVADQCSILDAVKILDTVAGEAVLVVDSDMKLLGTVTDGDVRRGLLRSVDMGASVQFVMNKNPHKVSDTISRHDAFIYMRRHVLRQLPIVDARGRVVGVHTLSTMLDIPSKNNTVVIMAGGLGSRLGELTKETPKPMLKVGDRPLLEYVLRQFVDQGFHNFTLSVNYKAEVIEEYFGDGRDFGANIEYIREGKRMGTAGSLSLMNDLPIEPMIVMNGDILTKMRFDDLLESHTKSGALATMCVREYSLQVPYGVVRTGDDGTISGIEEKPILRYYVNAGIYCVEPSILAMIPKDEFYDMPMLFTAIAARGLKAQSHPVQDYWMDIGRVSDLEKARQEFREFFA